MPFGQGPLLFPAGDLNGAECDRKWLVAFGIDKNEKFADTQLIGMHHPRKVRRNRPSWHASPHAVVEIGCLQSPYASPQKSPQKPTFLACITPRSRRNWVSVRREKAGFFSRCNSYPAKVAPAGSYRSGGGTYRATFGGALASRELWFGRSGSDRYLSLRCGLVTRVSGRIPFGASCPRWSLAREASTLSLATCPAGFSRRGIDPVGETSNVPDTPLGSRRLVVSTPAFANRRHPWEAGKRDRSDIERESGERESGTGPILSGKAGQVRYC